MKLNQDEMSAAYYEYLETRDPRDEDLDATRKMASSDPSVDRHDTTDRHTFPV